MRLFAAAALTMALALSGCMSPPRSPPPTFQRISFQSRPAFVLDVARIDLDERNAPPLTPPQVGHRFPVSPVQAIRDWTADRLTANGRGSGTMRVIVLAADAVQSSLPRTGGIRGAFTRDQSEAYTVTIALLLEIRDPATGRSASAEARAVRSATVAEDVTDNDRQVTWYKLTEGTISALDAELDRQIRQNFAPFLRGGF
jgi:hypothetical protein